MTAIYRKQAVKQTAPDVNRDGARPSSTLGYDSVLYQEARYRMPCRRAVIMAAFTPPIGGAIFVSYRRQDAAYPAGWLFDRLIDHFGRDVVFKDVDSIGLGDDFVAAVAQALESCAVLLAVIGRQWLIVTDDQGNRRLDDQGDFVRFEIETALARGIAVIPVLVDGARMPMAIELPASLSALAYRQALELRPNRFASDVAGLLGSLAGVIDPAGPKEHVEHLEPAPIPIDPGAVYNKIIGSIQGGHVIQGRDFHGQVSLGIPHDR